MQAESVQIDEPTQSLHALSRTIIYYSPVQIDKPTRVSKYKGI